MRRAHRTITHRWKSSRLVANAGFPLSAQAFSGPLPSSTGAAAGYVGYSQGPEGNLYSPEGSGFRPTSPVAGQRRRCRFLMVL
jgi:hypothetical protein